MTTTEARLPVGLLTASLVAVACASAMVASFQYVVVDMQTALGFSSDSANALTFMPMAASLLVVFIAGSLADRWGARPVQICAVSCFTAGATLVAVAPNLVVVVAGRILDGIGGVTMAIVAVAVINSAVTEPRLRARVFGFYAAVTPVAFTVVPPLSALLVQEVGWRAGMLPGIALGLLALLTTFRFVPRESGLGRSGRAGQERVTPLLAGVVLAGIGLCITGIPVSLTLAVTAALVGAGALLALVVLMRRWESPTLNLKWCRERGIALLLIAMALAAMPNLFFYVNLLLQYRYGAPLILIAILLISTQATAAAGGLLSGPVSSRIGPAQAAAIGLVACGALRLTTLFVTADSPIWVPVLGLAASSAPAAFVIGPMINTLLTRAPTGDSGIGSSVNKATWTLGSVIGGAVIGAVTFNAFQSRLTDILNMDGLSLGAAEIIAKRIRDGAAVADLAVHLSNPIARDDLIARGPGLVDAQIHAFAVMGVVSALMTFAAAALMVLYIRRVRAPVGQHPAEQFPSR